MPGRMPIFQMPGRKLKAGTPGSEGGWGQAALGGLGALAGLAMPAPTIAATALGIIGGLIGKGVDELTRTEPTAPEVPPIRPQFSQPSPYKVKAATRLSDPGAGYGVPMGPTVRLGAAKSLKSKLF